MKIAVALISGLLMGLTTAPVETWFLAWVALAPLWVLINDKKESNYSNSLIIALAWGLGYHGLALFWITGIHPMTWMGVPWLASLAIAFFCWLFITLWGAAIVVAWAGIMRMKLIPVSASFSSSFTRVLVGVALWCCLENIWSGGPLWWSGLSYTQSPHNLAILQWSQLSGPSTVTAAIVAVNGLIGEGFLVLAVRKLFYAIALLLLIGFHSIGLSLYNRPVETVQENAIQVGIIQGNIPNEIKLYPAGFRQAIERYTTGYQTLATSGVDVVLTPETALPFAWQYLVDTNASFYQAILELGVPAWLGAFGNSKGEISPNYTNSLFTISSTGETLSRYDKVKLVPLGEYIPFEEFFGSFIDRLSPLDAHLIKGQKEQVFSTPFGEAIVGICYESAFAEHFRRQTAAGGEFILTAANNAHYSNTMPAQHHAQDVMRAVESDRWAARATNTGYSAIINPRGKTVWISQINKYQLHADTIYRRKSQTWYVKWGDWLTPMLFFLAVTASLINYKKRE